LYLHVGTERVPVFDLDGTLLDSDRALVAPFLALGVPEEKVTFGLTLPEACSQLGLALDSYLAHYDVTAARPFPGVDDLLRQLSRWAIFSNKSSICAEPEIARLGWKPELALYYESFHGPKRLDIVLQSLNLTPADIICIGDSPHDRACATSVGADFALAGWNPRAAADSSDIVLSDPAELLDLLFR
jgi:phosphoglycolate phosphatase-like HAD superfamily hydrolase